MSSAAAARQATRIAPSTSWGMSSSPIPNDVVAVRAGTDPNFVERLAAALDHLGDNQHGAFAKDLAFKADGFKPGDDADFAPVRTLADSFADVAH